MGSRNDGPHRPAPSPSEMERGKSDSPLHRRWRGAGGGARLPWFPLAFVAIILFGLLLRVARLHSIPPGLFFDEAANLFDVSDVLHGAHPLYFPRNNGREAFFFYWASLFASVWGTTPYAIRLASAVIGALTVVATFLCAREMLRCWTRDRWRADWTALAAAFVLGITYTHLHYSRIGLRSITLPFFLALCYGLLFRGLRRKSWWLLVFAGAAGGLSFYTYISARIAPVPLLVLPVATGLTRRSWRPVLQLVAVGLVWISVCLPFGVYALRHPQDVMGHTDDVSILNLTNNHGDPQGAVIHGVLATLGAFSIAGTENADQNLPGRPILDPILSLFLALGLIALVVEGRSQPLPRPPQPGEGEVCAPRRVLPSLPRGGAEGGIGLTDPVPRAAVAWFLVAWIVTQSLPSVLSVGPPGYIRLTGTFPALAILISLGVGYAFRGLALRRLSATRAAAILGGALVISTAWTIRDYFWIWGPSVTAYHWMMGDKVDSSTYLNRWASESRVFLAPLYARDNTIRFLTRDAAIQSFDLGASLVVPTDRSRPVRYVFPASDQQEVAKVSQELPVRPSAITVADPSGRFTLLTALEIPPTALPAAPPARVATFDGGIALVGAVTAPSASPGGSLAVTLEWLDLQPQPYDYTAFVHVRDASNHAVAQMDRQPTAGSYPTTAWHPGDLIWDRYGVAIPPNTPGGEYRVVVGLYRLATMQRLTLIPVNNKQPTNEVTIGTVRVVSSP